MLYWMLYWTWYSGWALWVAVDGFSRGLRIFSLLWAAGTFALGPIVLPIYFAIRPLKLRETRRGGVAWNIARNLTIYWSILMGAAFVYSPFELEKVRTAAKLDVQRFYLSAETLSAYGEFGLIWLLPTALAVVIGLFLRDDSVCQAEPSQDPEEYSVQKY